MQSGTPCNRFDMAPMNSQLLPVRQRLAAECHKLQGQLLAPASLAIGVTALRGLAVGDRPYTEIFLLLKWFIAPRMTASESI